VMVPRTARKRGPKGRMGTTELAGQSQPNGQTGTARRRTQASLTQATNANPLNDAGRPACQPGKELESPSEPQERRLKTDEREPPSDPQPRLPKRTKRELTRATPGATTSERCHPPTHQPKPTNATTDRHHDPTNQPAKGD